MSGNRVVRLPAVKVITGMARSTLYRSIKAGEFPRPIPLGARAVGWLESDIEAWLQSRIRARRAA